MVFRNTIRRKVLDLLAAGRSVTEVARDLGISNQTIYLWRRQEAIDKGLMPGPTSSDLAELVAARRRIRELETELAVARRAMELSSRGGAPKRRFEVIRVIVVEAMPAQLACRVLGASESGYYAWRERPPSERAIRHAWLTDLIRQIHAASRATYGARRVHAELTLGRGIAVGHSQVELLMRRAGLAGLPARRRFRAVSLAPSVADLVERDFSASRPDALWITGITEHPTREGKVYCCVVLDAFSRRVVGWSIDASQSAALVTNALGMALESRSPNSRTILHSDHGTQFASWAFTSRAKDSGLLASMGSIGDCFDNAVAEAFWARMQVELLNRRRWRTRLELANAIFEYLEIFHNRQRRHSALGMRTPVEYERLYGTTNPAA